jgi:hypothetical protein
MNKEFAPYEEALSLKELGFDEPCFGYYQENRGKVIIENSGLITNSNFTKILSETKFRLVAPLYQQAFKFFREKHDLDYNIYPYTEQFKRSYLANIFVGTEEKRIVTENRVSIRFYSKEEAELACLKKLIEIIKNK